MDMSLKKNDRGSQIKWTENMDALLIEALLHRQQIGNRINGQWTSSSYDMMVKELLCIAAG
ncbi:3-epi-6-deoxocathasterone 23-monooxygenase [Bienertia sinuspersici]